MSSKPQKRPENAIIVQTYDKLCRYIRHFADGKLNLLILVGLAGLEKSRLVKSEVGLDVCWIEGNATAFGMFCRVFECLDQPVVIDDVDSLYADRAAVRLLKCLCQTEEQKTVAWHSYAKALDYHGIPHEFTTRSPTLIIANEWRSLNNNIKAIEDRGYVLAFEPSPLEVHLRTATWFHDQQVFDFIGQHLHLVAEPSMRDYVKAAQLREAGEEWQGYLLEKWGLNGRRLLVAQLKADGSYATEEDRARAFAANRGGCRATYFNIARTIRSHIEPPRILLKNDSPQRAVPAPDVLNLLRSRQSRFSEG